MWARHWAIGALKFEDEHEHVQDWVGSSFASTYRGCRIQDEAELVPTRDAGSSRGILRLRRTIPLLLEEIYSEAACGDSYVRKLAQKQTGNVYF